MFAKIIKQLLCIAAMLFAFGSSRAQVHYLEDAALARLQEQARLTGKKIMLVCCTEWCGPCQSLKKEHFKDSSVGEIINSRYVVGYYDMEKGRGITIGKKYGVRRYPTMLFLSAENRLIERLEGTFSEIPFLITALKGLDSARNDLYPGISPSINLPFPRFYDHYFEVKQKEKVPAAVVDAYLNKQKNLFSEVNWRVMSTLDHAPKYDSFLMNNYQQYLKLYNNEAKLPVNKLLSNLLKESIATQDQPRFEQVINFMERNNFPEARIIERKLSYYGKTGADWDKYNDLLNEYLSKYKGNIAAYCGDILDKPFPEKLGHTCMYWIDEKLKNDNSPWLYIYKGLFLEVDRQKSEAEKLYKTALDLAAESSRELYSNSIKEYRKKLPVR